MSLRIARFFLVKYFYCIDKTTSVNLFKIWNNRSGVTSVEYALLGSILAIVISTAGAVASSALQRSLFDTSYALWQTAEFGIDRRNTCHHAVKEDVARHTLEDNKS